MNKNYFRAIAIANLVFITIAVIFTINFPMTLPAELDNFVKIQHPKNNTAYGYFILFVIVLALIANVGLIFLAKWSRTLFTLCTIILVLDILVNGPVVETAQDSFLSEIEAILTGIIIALAYYSDISNHLEHTKT